MVNTILAKRVNHIVAKGDIPVWPKGSKSRGFSSRNVNAKKSLTGIGYQYEGRLYQYEFDKGEYIDIDVYSLLRKNYFSNE